MSEEIALLDHDGGMKFVEIGQYPDGMPVINLNGLEPDDYKGLLLRPTNMSNFVAGLFLADAFGDRGYGLHTLVLPLIPGSRQDRLNNEGDYLFTAKSVADMINQRDFDEVIVFDPHSDVAPALINYCKVIKPSVVFNVKKVWTGWDGVIAPDAGAAKRSFDIAQILGVDFIQAEKHRDVATGKLSGFAAHGLEKGKHYLVADDICDGGGTFLGLAQVIKEAGATADLYVSHGIFSQGTDKLLAAYKQVLTTNSTAFPSPGVKKIDILERLLHTS